jgi:hypothetical protein
MFDLYRAEDLIEQTEILLKLNIKKHMNYPILIIRKDDDEEFIHLGDGLYRTKWGLMNNSILQIPFESFDKVNFKFYYK